MSETWTDRGPGNGVSGYHDSIKERLLRDRILFLEGEVRDEMANDICASSCCCPPRTQTRTSTSTSTRPVAPCRPGMAIYDTMQFVKSDVATVGMGMAASMGQFLLTAGATGKRYALPHCAHHDAPAVRRPRRRPRRSSRSRPSRC